MEETGLKKSFTNKLLAWNKAANKRQMPWKGEKDPYKIWLSEIILQQTRVEQGLKYYERFIETFPTVHHLANAPEQEVFKLWEGLGYYSRCRNLIKSAQYISKELNGVFPHHFSDIIALKGVGHYTAAAIASFAYNLPYAVLDGNVFRVLSRIGDIETPIDSTVGKKQFASLAQSMLPPQQSAEYNQAIMDFGATVCKPVPECAICFYKDECEAFLQGKQQLLPVKAKRIVVKERWFNYIVLRQDGKYACKQRVAKDIWQNLYEFVLFETSEKTKVDKVLEQFEKSYSIKKDHYQLVEEPIHLQQRLTHQIINFQFIKAEFVELPRIENLLWLSQSEIKKLPFPKSLQQYILSQL